jgi:rhodanese-related sulfurtransferase
MRSLLIFALFSTFLFASSPTLAAQGAGEDFPGRSKFPTIPYIELDELHTKLNGFIIVDARSTLEFDTLRIKGAINIPLSKKSFEKDVAKLRQASKQPIAFYCNGHSCMKSYIAAQKAIEANISEVYAFDAGVFDWTKAHPEQAVLLGNSPVNITHLIPKSKFKKHLLSPIVFSDKATSPNHKTMVIDVRDKFQRAGIGFYPGLERWASLDQQAKIQGYVKKALKQQRTLLIYDEVGKQVRWLQYALEKAGATDYYFMNKGARGYYQELLLHK